MALSLPALPATASGQTSERAAVDADGAWQGAETTVDLPDNLIVDYGWLKGEGAYEGLSFFTSYHDDTASDVHRGQGMIWPGEPPPFPDAALLQADPLD